MLVSMNGIIGEHSLPNSWLMRIYSNGTHEWLAGVKGIRTDKSFSLINFFVQLNMTHILIGDNLMGCIRVLNERTRVVSTFSGKCFIETGDDIRHWPASASEDGGYQSATYALIGVLSRSTLHPNYVFVPDSNKVRELNLENQVVTTVFKHERRDLFIGKILWRDDHILLATSQGLEAYHFNWTLKEQVIQQTISTLSGTVYREFREFQMSGLTKDIIVLSFNYKKESANLRSAAQWADVIYSLSEQTSVLILNDGDSTASFFKSNISYIIASSSTGKIYFIHSYESMPNQTFCSALKVLPITGSRQTAISCDDFL